MKRFLAAAGITALLTLFAMELQTRVHAQPQPSEIPEKKADTKKSEGKKLDAPPGLAVFMRLKLTASNRILEGLAMDDMELVQRGAKDLNIMSTAEKWRVSRDPMYKQFSEEFQRNTADLMKAAETHNLDQAALKWMASTMNCIDCHRFVRNQLVVGGQP